MAPLLHRLAFATTAVTATVIVASSIPALAALPFSQASQPTPLDSLARLSGEQRPAGASAMDWVEANRSAAPPREQILPAAILAAKELEDRNRALQAIAILRAQGVTVTFDEANRPVFTKTAPGQTRTESALQTAPQPLLPGRVIPNARITFYACIGNGFCNTMAGGKEPYEGAAACSYDLPLGTRLQIVSDPTRRIYTCEDRGYLSPTWIDVFFWDVADGWPWQRQVGSRSDIVIVE
ncbi:MAG TPA: hypothetical protein VNM43_08010 [Dehalococcoidia bacterium]|nr:hypothetical protein [Dehalococcoidia bacterium]